MSKTLCVVAGLMMPGIAFAASVEDPVKAVMDVAVGRWIENGSSEDYFDKQYLDRDYSTAFQAAYHAAEKYPAYDEGTQPFDYDVITSSQDGCPLKDLKIVEGDVTDGTTTVDVSFRLMDCAESAEDKARVSELKFDVITEDGKPVISDIHRLNEGKWDSLVGEMQELVKIGEQGETSAQ
jgi:hypothetical protein